MNDNDVVVACNMCYMVGKEYFQHIFIEDVMASNEQAWATGQSPEILSTVVPAMAETSHFREIQPSESALFGVTRRGARM